ncbi:MAG: glycosyltransferase family 2 protein [Coriobacteriia bacterium]|nr:glycosyltransferase family 2 protein [Coriobacteriia bacterium]
MNQKTGRWQTLFSVIVPAYNMQDTLAETLDSVLMQGWQDWECIIVNDGSTDDTAGIAQAYCEKDSRFVLVTQVNTGIAAAYNAGIAQSCGQWIIMLSADDLLLPPHLTWIAAIAVDNGSDTDSKLAIISSNGYYLYDNGSRMLAYPNNPWFTGNECSLEDLFDRCFFSTGVALRRDAIFAAGGFIPDFYAEDYYLFLRILALGYRHHYNSAAWTIHRRNYRQRSADGLAMRKADLTTIMRVANEFALTESQHHAFTRACKKYQHNIRIRTILYCCLSSRVTENIIAALRRLRQRRHVDRKPDAQ